MFCLSAYKVGKKNSVLASETLNFEFSIDVLSAYTALGEANVVCHKSNVKQFCFSKQLNLCSI